MNRIYKYVLNTSADTIINMPKDATVLSLKVQHDKACIWCLVNTEKDNVERTFVTYATGQPIPEPNKFSYVGSYMIDNETLVFHVLEKLKK